MIVSKRTHCKGCEKKLTVENCQVMKGRYWNPRCRTCQSKASAKRQKEKLRSDEVIYYTYILPHEHYAGITTDVGRRRCSHKHEGKDVAGMKLISAHTNPYDAIIEEALLHKSGYNGCLFDSNYKIKPLQTNS